MKTCIRNLYCALAWAVQLAIPTVVQAQVNYAVSGSTAYVTNSPGASGNIVIASTYNGYPVTSIGEDAFYQSGLTSVTIPDSVTSIGNAAFQGCASLTNVTIPNSVTSIGDSAFYGSGLTTVTVPTSVTNIGDGAFMGCFSLRNIAVDVANPNYASTGGVLFNKSLTMLIQCPPGLQGSYAIPNSVTNISKTAFYSCTLLTNVAIPNSVTAIGHGAFGACSALTSVTIPDSVTSIGSLAFDGCTGLTNVTIPNSVTSIGGFAFDGCPGLTNVTVEASNPNYSSLNGVLFDKLQTTLIQVPGGLVGSYTIPNSVTDIGDFAFAFCNGLTGVTIGNGVTSLGGGAFMPAA